MGGRELSYGNLYRVLEQINQTQHKNKLNFYSSLIENLYPKYPFLSMPIPTKNKKTNKETIKDVVRQIYEEFTTHSRGMNGGERDKLTEFCLTDYAKEAGLVKPKQKKITPKPNKKVEDYMKGKGIASE